MVYVARDDKGRIAAVSRQHGPRTSEAVEEDDPELTAFLAQARLSTTDAGMGRITEDLLDVLVSRNVINFTDLPRRAQQKLLNRQSLRRRLSELATLIADDDELI